MTKPMRVVHYRGDGPFSCEHGWGRQIIAGRWRYLRRVYLTGKRYGPLGEWIRQVTPWRKIGEKTDDSPTRRGVCRVCGCTDHRACNGGCSWADRTHTICTRCRVPTGEESVRGAIEDAIRDGRDGRRNGQGARTRKIRSLWMRICNLTFGSIEFVPEKYSKQLHEILEEAIR